MVLLQQGDLLSSRSPEDSVIHAEAEMSQRHTGQLALRNYHSQLKASSSPQKAQ